MTTTTAAQAARGDDLSAAAVLECDPPWEHRDKLGPRGARANYETMSTEAICQLELPRTADRHVLFLWRLANMPQDALNVCRAWEFEPLAEVVWEKLRPCQQCCGTGLVDVYEIHGARVLVPGADHRCPDCLGRRGIEVTDDDLGTYPAHLGMGTTVRNAHETCIIARPIGGRAPERLHADVRSYFAAPMLIDVDGLLRVCVCGHHEEEHGDGCNGQRRGEPCACEAFQLRRGALVHSAKPDQFYALVERIYPGPYVSMFSRRTRAKWRNAHSNQDRKLDEVAKIMRDVWPARTREERLAEARRAAAKR